MKKGSIRKTVIVIFWGIILFIVCSIVLAFFDDATRYYWNMPPARQNLILIAGIVLLVGILYVIVLRIVLSHRRRIALSMMSYAISLRDLSAVVDSPVEFVENYEEMLSVLTELYNRKGLKKREREELAESIQLYKHEYQWQLRNSIERFEKKALSDIKKYANSREYKKNVYMDFVDELVQIKDRCEGDETWEHIRKASEKIYIKSGADEPFHLEVLVPQQMLLEENNSSLDDVDQMDGHEFEYWCADVLKRNGYNNVEVTPGSGDQGVDILAIKDEIKYAFQCKNYSGALGNTPVQEVNSGKKYYKCHVGVVITNNYFTQSAKDLAIATGIILWDRDKLASMMK